MADKTLEERKMLTAARVYREGFMESIKSSLKLYQRMGLYVALKYLWNTFNPFKLPFLDRIAFWLSTKKLESFDGEDVNEIIDFARNFQGYGRYKTIEPMQMNSEIKELVEKIQDWNPDVVMEIGTARGGTFFILAQAVDADHFISLDLPGGRYGGGYSNKREKFLKAFTDEEVDCLRRDSHDEETLEKTKDVLGGKKIDFLFIDGDHSYEGVKKDFKMYRELVGQGGVIAFHDIVDHGEESRCEVDRFWNEVKEKYETREIVENWDQGWRGIGVVFV